MTQVSPLLGCVLVRCAGGMTWIERGPFQKDRTERRALSMICASYSARPMSSLVFHIVRQASSTVRPHDSGKRYFHMALPASGDVRLVRRCLYRSSVHVLPIAPFYERAGDATTLLPFRAA